MMKREQLLKLICDNTGKRINLPNFTIEELEDFANAVVAAESAANLQRALVAEKDVERIDWLDRQGFAYGFQDIHEGNRWEIYGGYMNLRDAIDCGIKCDTSTQSTDQQNVLINGGNIDTSEKT